MSRHHQQFASQAVVDRAFLVEVRVELGDAFGGILDMFADDGLMTVAAIEDLSARNDRDALAAAAHNLKGEARQFGCDRLAAISLALERGMRAPSDDPMSSDDVRALVAQLRPCFLSSIAALRVA